MVAVHDVGMSALAFELSVAIAHVLNGFMPNPFALPFSTLSFALISGLVFWRTGLYRGIWYYASLNDLIAILKAVVIALGLFLLVQFQFTRLEYVPRSALLMVAPLLVVLLMAPRLLYRSLKDGNFSVLFERQDGAERIPVLLVGATDAADTFIREMGRKRSNYRIIGIVDRKSSRLGRDIRGVRVMGHIDNIADIVESLPPQRRPRRLIVADETLSGNDYRQLLTSAETLGLKLARLPRLTEFKSGDLDRLEIRPVDVEDLLGRAQKTLDRAPVRELVSGKRVLITGAGGTIGGELCRQILELAPHRLSLVEDSEFALYSIHQELTGIDNATQIIPILGDVRDIDRMADIFSRETPEIVFHAAAFKHVPLVESNPTEGVLTNVLGSRNITDLCVKNQVATLVLISTDKAVNPTSVMGATKRIAEMYGQATSLARQDQTPKIVTVRFGNVLGSTGSVVPLFQRQLAKGGPLTVTHPEVTRYFMTVREAVELVLQAASLPQTLAANSGKIFVLDMGEPVLIDDLARQMIRLAGLTPDKDIAIHYTGLRPGEKLYEEVFHEAEALQPTQIEGVELAAPRFVDIAELSPKIDQLVTVARARRETETIQLIQQLIPEYGPEDIDGKRRLKQAQTPE